MTCCPSCRTTFCVTPEQLAQAQAWLRCGRCERVFDSTGLVVSWQLSSPPEDAIELAAPQDMLSAGTVQVPSPQGGRGLWFAALILLCVLPVLLMIPHRQALLLRWPQIGPMWSKVCVLAKCEVPALVRAQDVVIDSSSFVPQAQGYTLGAVLRNQGGWSVLPSALELTLLDAQEQVVLRRVFTPEQMQLTTVLAPEQTWELRLDFSLEGDAPTVNGYRLRSVQP